MFINQIQIKNFRCLKNITVEFENLTAMIGRNGAGKSTILKALDIFYDLAYRPDEEDFCNKNIEEPIEIIVSFDSLLPKEMEAFGRYVKDGMLTVKKILPFNDTGKFYSYWPQIPEFSQIRQISGAADKKNEFNSLVVSGKYPELTTRATSAARCDQLMEEFENNHSHYCEPSPGPFLGAAHVGGGSVDNFTKFVLIPAIKEVADETTERRGTVIKRLLDVLVLRRINARADIKQFKEDFEKRASKLFNAENLPELEEAGENIDKILKSFAPESGFRMKWGTPTVPEVPPPPTIVSLIEDGFEGDVARKGHGLQRALIFSLLQYEASLRAIEERPGSPDEEDRKESIPEAEVPCLILSIEEPELYQHPQRCRALAQILNNLANQDQHHAGNQILFTTHSPLFINLDQYHQIRLLRRHRADETTAPVVLGRYSLEQLAADLRELTGGEVSRFTPASARARSMPIMDTISNEGFFADAVVVVEGFGEAGFLWALQDILGKNWPSKGISIIPARGKNKIDRHVLIFRGFGLPTYYLFDGDAKFRDKGNSGEEKAKKDNKLLLRLGHVSEVDFPESQVGDLFACFEFDIEHLAKESMGEDDFNRIGGQVAVDLGYSSWKKALKNLEAGDEFIRRVYSEGFQLAMLEEIVEKVSSLV
ncbi:MAG: DUF2813 domain-containing protein [Desulfarculus sp.]|jgi:energy-coupling factor transporter ATP-binding protein EcfA2|nr:MAG: DUF2813 domain-containing protein [Desulfarculus sp.]